MTTTKGPAVIVFDDGSLLGAEVCYEGAEDAARIAKYWEAATGGNNRATVIPIALAAAAPYLLDTLKRIDAIYRVGQEIDANLAARIGAAIAKAEGR